MHPIIFGVALPNEDPNGIPVCKECYNDAINHGFSVAKII